ncbi:MAG: amino acid kinase family protein [Candidatus Hodarchaeales archaeon]
MKKTQFTVIKLGGSLITHKRDTHLIEQYLNQIDLFLAGKGSMMKLTQRISDLMNFPNINAIFRVIASFQSSYPNEKLVLIHGAGSIGHSLVLHLKKQTNFHQYYPIIKLVVTLQNQMVVATAIEHGMNAITFPSHTILTGQFTKGISSKKADSKDLTHFEEILTETDAIPVFFGDVGPTSNGWKVFSGDIIPTALTRRINRTQLARAFFLTNVEGKVTGIYSKDPIYDDAEMISLITVHHDDVNYYNSTGKLLTFSEEEMNTDFDVTSAMKGKLSNIIELAKHHTKCWVVGINEFEKALLGESLGTLIKSKSEPRAHVVFLGTGDAFGSGGHKSASTLLKIRNKGILFDCGPHTLQSLKKSGRSTEEIDIILISHFHGDHQTVPYFLLEASIQQQRTKPLLIIGPQEVAQKIKTLYSVLYEAIAESEKPFPYKVIIITPSEPVILEDITIQAFNMHHTPEAQGYRVETDDFSIAVTGDTGWTDNLIPLIRNTKLAVVECNFFDSEVDIHLNYQQILKISSQTDRLALVHLGEEMIKNIPTLKIPPNIIIPLEGQEISI